jgi:hypothetical protein
LSFFLAALVEQARVNGEKARGIISLYDELKVAFPEVTRSQFAGSALDAFFANPIMTGPMFFAATTIRNRGTAYEILRKLVNADLIKVVLPSAGRRPTIYALTRLITLAEGGDWV